MGVAGFCFCSLMGLRFGQKAFHRTGRTGCVRPFSLCAYARKGCTEAVLPVRVDGGSNSACLGYPTVPSWNRCPAGYAGALCSGLNLGSICQLEPMKPARENCMIFKNNTARRLKFTAWSVTGRPALFGTCLDIPLSICIGHTLIATRFH